MKVEEVINLLESKFPISSACEWDYTGWQVKANNLNLSVTSIMLTLDVNNQVIKQAIKSRTNLIICHHPFFFEEQLENLENNIWKSSSYKLLMENNINLYVIHTNFDRSIDGMNMKIAQDLKFNEINFFNNQNLAVIGKYNNINLEIIIKNIKKYFNKEKLEVITSNLTTKINKVILAAGAGGSLIQELPDYSFLAASNVLLITGEMKWHQQVEAFDKNINVIIVGHNMEEKFIDFVSCFLNDNSKIKKYITINKFFTHKSFFI